MLAPFGDFATSLLTLYLKVVRVAYPPHVRVDPINAFTTRTVDVNTWVSAPRILDLPSCRRRAWLKAVDTEPKAIWIVKPPASSCGRGIRVINKASSVKVSKSKKCLVQVGSLYST